MATAATRRSLLDMLARPWTLSKLIDRPVYAGGWHGPDVGLWDELLAVSAAAQAGCAEHYARFVRSDIAVDWDHGSSERSDAGAWSVQAGVFESPAAAFLPPEAAAANFVLVDSKVAWRRGEGRVPRARSVRGAGRWRRVLRGGEDALAADDDVRGGAAPSGDAEMGVRPLVVLLAPTGDHGFARRRLLHAQPLARLGISSLILQTPFYGERKPANQYRSSLLHVSDLFAMGTALVSETLSLITALEAAGRYNVFGVSGASLGGQMACHVACVARDRPLALVPSITPHAAGPVFTDGVLSSWCAWDALEADLDRIASRVAHPTGGTWTAPAFMAHILDTTTNITRYAPPPAEHAIIQIAALADGYVPEPGRHLAAHWPASELRWVSGGHIKAYAMDSDVYVRAIQDAFTRLVAPPPQ